MGSPISAGGGDRSHVPNEDATEYARHRRIRQEASDLEDSTRALGYSPEQSARIAQMHLERSKLTGRPLRTYAMGFMRHSEQGREPRHITKRRAANLLAIDRLRLAPVKAPVTQPIIPDETKGEPS